MELAADGRLGTLGPAHPDTLVSWASLTLLYSQSGCRDDRGRELLERIAAGWEQVVAERERRLGPDAPETQSARLRLAGTYPWQASERRIIHERVIESWGRLADARSRRLGPVHPDTTAAREQHALCHRLIGRRNHEVALTEQIAADHERLLGPGDPRTLRALTRLAIRYWEGAYDTPAAIALAERIIGDAHDALGPEDTAVHGLRAMLLMSYTQAGRTSDARALQARFPALDEDE
jgi:hypothetical protein